MVCSFQKPEPWQPSYQSPMPPDVTPPEGCKDEAVVCHERAAAADNEYSKKLWVAEAEVLPSPHGSCVLAKRVSQHMGRSPVAIRSAGDHYEEGVLVCYTWMKVKHIPECDLAYQKVHIAFASPWMFRLPMNFLSVFSDISRTSYCGFRLPEVMTNLDLLYAQYRSWLQIAWIRVAGGGRPEKPRILCMTPVNVGSLTVLIVVFFRHH